jgi:protein-L-isoaspartate(D-aspartate) O-methyltransferase
MVERQPKVAGHDERVLAAMGKVPREAPVLPESRCASYEDGPMPIGYDQTILSHTLWRL